MDWEGLVHFGAWVFGWMLIFTFFLPLAVFVTVIAFRTNYFIGALVVSMWTAIAAVIVAVASGDVRR